MANITGGLANDVLIGTTGADILDGGAGADYMLGDGGNDGGICRIFYLKNIISSPLNNVSIHISGKGENRYSAHGGSNLC